MEFEWDEDKRQSNIAKHGIDFDRAATLFDGRLLANGSFNWTRSATHNNDENLVVTDDANLVRVFGLQFEKLWQQFG